VRRFWFVTGIRSNLRGLLREAVETAGRHGFDARILDVGRIVPRWRNYPNEWQELGLGDLVDRPRSRDELSRFARASVDESATLLFLFPPNRYMRPIWRLLRRRGARIGVIMVGPIPAARHGPELRYPFFRPLVAAARRLKALLKPRPAYWVVSGSECLSQYRWYFRTLEGVQEIRAHSIEYENFLQARGTGDGNRPEVNVFLDQGWFTKPRPDFVSAADYPPTGEAGYQTAVRAFLRRLEEKTRRSVVVSCHPKADLPATRALYRGFEVQQGNTADWVKRASLVVANTSTSIQYAVLYDKPLLLFTSDELDRSLLRKNLEGYREELGVPVVNLDRPDAIDTALAQAAQARRSYARYARRYIKHPDSPERPLWEIIFQALEQTHDRAGT
jgi:hypothetical protein